MEDKWREILRSAPGAFGAIGTSDHQVLMACNSLELLALHHARLLSRSGAAAFGRGTADDAASGRAGASGAAATFLSMRVCRRSVASHARLLARSTSGGAASGRTGASGATQRVLRTHCDVAESASLAGDDASAARYTPQRTRGSNDALKGF